MIEDDSTDPFMSVCYGVTGGNVPKQGEISKTKRRKNRMDALFKCDERQLVVFRKAVMELNPEILARLLTEEFSSEIIKEIGLLSNELAGVDQPPRPSAFYCHYEGCSFELLEDLLGGNVSLFNGPSVVSKGPFLQVLDYAVKIKPGAVAVVLNAARRLAKTNGMRAVLKSHIDEKLSVKERLCRSRELRGQDSMLNFVTKQQELLGAEQDGTWEKFRQVDEEKVLHIGSGECLVSKSSYGIKSDVMVYVDPLHHNGGDFLAATWESMDYSKYPGYVIVSDVAYGDKNGLSRGKFHEMLTSYYKSGLKCYAKIMLDGSYPEWMKYVPGSALKARPHNLEVVVLLSLDQRHPTLRSLISDYGPSIHAANDFRDGIHLGQVYKPRKLPLTLTQSKIDLYCRGKKPRYPKFKKLVWNTDTSWFDNLKVVGLEPGRIKAMKSLARDPQYIMNPNNAACLPYHHVLKKGPIYKNDPGLGPVEFSLNTVACSWLRRSPANKLVYTAGVWQLD